MGWLFRPTHKPHPKNNQKGQGTKRPKIACSPSYADIRSRANTTRGLDYEHMIKARALKGGVRIGKTPKKLASICCP
jgi:hypothetical protein